MPLPNVVIASQWRNDADRRLNDRVISLTGKTYPNLIWLWGVGDSTDSTEESLRHIIDTANPEHRGRIFLYRTDSHILGNDPYTKMLRLCSSFNQLMEHVPSDADFVLWHESDLSSPADVVERMLARDKSVLAGWPILQLRNGAWVFYDTWAYRADGEKFTNGQPYHAVYKPDELFEVDSAGSMLLFPAHEVWGPDAVRCTDMGLVEMCAAFRARGHRIYVDPQLVIVQPTELWSSSIGWS